MSGKHELVSLSNWQWTEYVARRLGYRRFTIDERPFPESTEHIRRTQGKCIYKHLELKRLAVDPITLAQLEAEVGAVPEEEEGH